jgi:hypothetical protein
MEAIQKFSDLLSEGQRRVRSFAAEQAIFRGFLQNNLSRWLNGVSASSPIAILVAEIIFGMIHYTAGLTMILLASLAGIAYGIAYRYGGLLASITGQFGLNLCHILFFTYPLLEPR